MSGVTVKVEGLKAVAANLAEMSKRVQANISRAALRAAARVLSRAIKAKSGTTYTERTGAVRKGFSAGVGRVQKTGGIQYASVFQRASAAAVREQKATGKKRRSGRFGVSGMKSTAYWWRFLEGGTNRAAARPWIGDAASAASGDAVAAFRDTMKSRIEQEANSLPSTRGKP